MKKFAVLAAALIVMAGMAHAAEFTHSNLKPGMSGTGPAILAPVDITQNLSFVPQSGLGVACGSGGYAAINHFLRRFFLATDHALSNQLDVASVDMGVETVNLVSGTCPIDGVTLSIANGAAFTFANMTELARTTNLLVNTDSLTVPTWVVGGSIANPATTDLVVDMYVPDDGAVGSAYGFWPGCDNTVGQLHEAYIASSDCSISEPVTMTGIGFPDAMWIVIVHGDEVPVELQTFTVN